MSKVIVALDYPDEKSTLQLVDKIDPAAKYSVCNITVPVFGHSQTPELSFAVGSIHQDLTGGDIEDIAKQLKEASVRVTKAARNSAPGIRF